MTDLCLVIQQFLGFYADDDDGEPLFADEKESEYYDLLTYTVDAGFYFYFLSFRGFYKCFVLQMGDFLFSNFGNTLF